VEKSLGAEAVAMRSAQTPNVRSLGESTFGESTATEYRRQHLHTRRVDAVEASQICGEE
jgi:hypothetical protein